MHYNCLIVDDEIELSKMTAEYFQMFDISTAYVSSAEACYTFLKENTVDLMLLDINLGDGSGFEVCKKVREELQLPILFISARQGDDDVLIALSIGGDDYIIKPFSMAQLAAKIKAFLKRYGDSRPACVTYLDLTADRKERKMYLGDKEIALQPREFDVLLYLMEHPERLVSKEELLARVWGAESDALPRNLDNPIKNIRKATETSEAKIVTLRGYGYRLETKNG